ncbi:MAG: alpha/beta hydrolase [Acidimicrobiales bacterium]
MAMIDLNGQRTWVLVPKKKGDVVLLLHGGMSSSASLLSSIGPHLKKRFRLAAFDRRGHGKSPDTDQPFHYADMADQTIAFIEHLGRKVHLVGHSDGGNVALLVVLKRPDLVKRAVVVGANFNHRGLVPVEPMRVGSPGFVEWAQKYGSQSPDGIAHAEEVLKKSQRLFAREPRLHREELNKVGRPVLVMAGDDDVALLSHTCALFESMPDAQLAIVPGASHGVLKEQSALCASMIERFLTQTLPPATRAPIRRPVPSDS